MSGKYVYSANQLIMQKLVIFLVCSLCSLALDAQFGVKAGVSYGLTYGNRQVIEGQSIESYRPSLGYQVGVSGRVVKLGPTLAVAAELVYESRRSVTGVDYDLPEFPDSGGHIRGDVRNRMDYLSLPVLLTVAGEKLSVYAGPSFSYLLSGKRRYDVEALYITIAGPQVVTIDDAIDLTGGQNYEGPVINRLNLALNAGVSLPLTSALALDLRLYHTLTDVTNDSEDTGVLRPISVDGSIFERDDFDSTLGVQANLVFRF
jgi:hypothetical protein